MGCLRVGELVCVGWCCVFVYMIALFGVLLGSWIFDLGLRWFGGCIGW